MSKTIGVLVGSLRKESFSRKIAQAIIAMAPEGFTLKIIEAGQLPLYNQDYDDYNETPEAYRVFRNELNNLHGVIFITPEHNRSMPAVLKNALDVGSRPYGKNCWDGKPGAVISCSTGNISGFGANHHLRQSLVFLNVLTMQQPEAYIAKIQDSIKEDGTLDERCTKLIAKVLTAYTNWFKRLM